VVVNVLIQSIEVRLIGPVKLMATKAVMLCYAMLCFIFPIHL
jgi:hypothetical protein